MKSVKIALWSSLFCTMAVLLLCTIKNDNGNLALTGPNTINTNTPAGPTVPPVIIITADSSYVGLKETLNIAVKVMKDSTFSKPSVNAPVFCSVTGGLLSRDTLFTDSNGRATVWFTDSVKSTVTLTATCFGDTQKLSIQVTDAPDRIQQSIRIVPTKAILKADGKDNTTINVTIRNQDNNPIGAGECVKFITTSGTIMGANATCNDPGKSATDAQGLAQAILTSENKNDTAYITAFLVSDKTKSAETKVVFQGVTIKLAADSTNLKVGGKSTIIATLLNASNEPIPYMPIYFLLGKDSASSLSIVSRDTATGSDGIAVVVVKSTKTGADSVRVFAAGAASSAKITVTDLSLGLILSDKVLQARESDSTFLHILLLDKNNNGISKNIKLTEYFQKSDGTDTSAMSVITTNALGKADFTVYALPYEGTMRLEAVAFDNTGDLASAVTTVSFITTRTMTVYAIPTVIQADGTSRSQITLQIKNKQNNPVVGDAIQFTSDAGMVTASDTTDGNGIATAFLTSDRRNTIATVTATLAKDPTKYVSVQVEFSGVNLSATAVPPSINSSGKDTSIVSLTLLDAAKNPIVGEKVNFYPRHPDGTHLSNIDSVTNNRGEAMCKVSGTGTGFDTISVKAAGTSTTTIISYSSNYLAADTAFWQPCIANGNDSTQIRIRYFQGDKSTPISNAVISVSVTVGSISASPVFVKQFTLAPSDQGKIFFFMKNPNFATTATISVQAQTAQEMTSTTYQLYFKASKIKRIVLTGSPEVIAINNGSTANRAKITGIAYDSLNNLVKGELVGFNMIHGPGGGEYFRPYAGGGGGDFRGFVAQRLQHPPDAVIAFGRTDQHRHHQALREFPPEIAEDLFARRFDVGKQFFHQMLVVIGEPFEHREPRFLLGVLVGDVDGFGRRVFAEGEGAFERQIDVTGHDLVFPDGNLAQQQRQIAGFLQHGKNLAERAARLVDLVDEHEMGNLEIGETLQIRLEHLNLGGFRLDDDDGRIHALDRVQRILQEFDRTGAVEEGETLIQIGGSRAIDLDAHLARAGFRTAVADGVALGDGSFARRRSGGEQNALQQRGLAAAVRSYQGHGAWPFSSVRIGHYLPPWGPGEGRSGLFVPFGRVASGAQFVDKPSRRWWTLARGRRSASPHYRSAFALYTVAELSNPGSPPRARPHHAGTLHPSRAVPDPFRANGHFQRLCRRHARLPACGGRCGGRCHRDPRQLVAGAAERQVRPRTAG